tara:strand:+ start:3602 stop:4408 length:807 start_codon:yes stop_codon:yes gene_type:complete
MNDALKMFEINNISEIDLKQLKKKYMKKAIQLHPDKGGSNEEFITLQNNYEMLKTLVEENEINDFDKLCNTFIKFMTCEKEENKKVLHNDLLDLFNNISNDWYNKLDSQYKIILKMLYEKYNKITSDKKIINLFVSFEDVYNDNIYKLYYDNNLFLVPLWCKECSFDYNNIEINVKIFIDLPENVSIDENNNICIFKNYNLLEIVRKPILEINISSINIPIRRDSILLKENQLIEFKNRGLLYPNQPINDDKLIKSTIYVKINLNLNV